MPEITVIDRPQLWFPPDEKRGVFQQCCQELDKFGITYIWHNLVKESQSVSLVSNKDWAYRYLEGNCTEFDIVDHFMYDRGINFFLWRDIADFGNTQQLELMREREADYQIYNGVTISLEHQVKDSGRYETTHRETLSLATDSQNFNLPEFCLAHYPVIREYLGKLTNLSFYLLEDESGKEAIEAQENQPTFL